jgi:hypothetical protein
MDTQTGNEKPSLQTRLMARVKTHPVITGIVITVIVVAVVLLIIWATGGFSGDDERTQTTASAVTDATPAVTDATPAVTDATSVAVALLIEEPKKATKIRLEKLGPDAPGDDVNWWSFQVSEVIPYDINGNAVAIVSGEGDGGRPDTPPELVFDGATDGSFWISSEGPGAAYARWIELTLATPTIITTVDVHNRTDCCWERLENVRLTLINNVGEVVGTQLLRGVKEMQSVTM